MSILNHWQIDVIGAVSFSRTFGFITSATDHTIFTRLRHKIGSVGWLEYAPWILKLHNKYKSYIGNWVAIDESNERLFAIPNEEVKSWKKSNSVRKDMAGLLADAQTEKIEMNDSILKATMNSNIFAGSNTTSTTLQATILMLLQHPEKVERLEKELEGKVVTGKLSDPPTFEELEGCRYLQGILYEGARLCPAYGSTLPRVVPVGGITINEKFVEAGVSIT